MVAQAITEGHQQVDYLACWHVPCRDRAGPWPEQAVEIECGSDPIPGSGAPVVVANMHQNTVDDMHNFSRRHIGTTSIRLAHLFPSQSACDFYRPHQTGGRFSTKAAAPSASSELRTASQMYS